MPYHPLPEFLEPLLIQVTLACDEHHIRKTYDELSEMADNDANKCFGYFPSMRNRSGIVSNLPSCESFSNLIPELKIGDKKLTFNFLRLSLIKQLGTASYHLDSDAATALTGDVTTVSQRNVWRLLLNLSHMHARTLSYLNVDSSTVKLELQGGYIHYPYKLRNSEAIKQAVIPPRQGPAVQGVLFCASRVLHTGKDDKCGHFVAGYGCDNEIPIKS